MNRRVRILMVMTKRGIGHTNLRLRWKIFRRDDYRTGLLILTHCGGTCLRSSLSHTRSPGTLPHSWVCPRQCRLAHAEESQMHLIGVGIARVVDTPAAGGEKLKRSRGMWSNRRMCRRKLSHVRARFSLLGPTSTGFLMGVSRQVTGYECSQQVFGRCQFICVGFGSTLQSPRQTP